MPEYLADLVRAKYPGAYDDMSDADLESAIKAKHPGAYDDIPTRSLPTRPVSAEDFAGPQAKPEGSALGRFASGVWEQVNPVNIVKGIAGAVEHPLDTGKALLGAQLEQFSKAKEVAGEGNYNEAAGRTLAGVLPLLGPAAAKAGEKIGSGDIAGGLGTGVGLVAPAALGAVTPKVVLGRAGAVAPEISYAEKTGIPLDVATATNNKFLQAAQHVADRSLAGSFVAENAQKAQAGRMASVADELAAQAHPSAVTPLQAGEAAQKGVRGVVSAQRAAADDAYTRLREIEARPENATEIAPDIKPPNPDAPFTFTMKPNPTTDEVFTDVLKDARANGYTGTAGELRMKFNTASDQARSLKDATAEGDEYSHAALLKEIRDRGGIRPFEKDVRQGAPTKLTREEAQAGQQANQNYYGKNAVYRNNGLAADDLVQQLSEDPKWGAVITPDTDIHELLRSGASAAPKPAGNIETFLHGVGVKPGTQWWREGEAPKSVPMAVDISETKAAMQPIYDRLKAESQLVPFVSGSGKGQAYIALDRLMNGPDVAPLSVADSALSDLKRMARVNDPNLRSAGQGIAARAVGNLHKAVSESAARAGPEAVDALTEGRIATKAKYAAADVLKTLEGANSAKSGATAYRGLTQAGDTSIGNLKATIAQSPDAKPLIARAVLDGVLNHPTAGAAKTWTDWQKLGPQTKAALFDSDHVQAIDNFLALRKRMANNPNPSGTGHTILTASQAGHLVLNPAVGVPVQLGAAAVTKLMHSPAGVRLLTRGMQIPARSVASRTAWLSDLAAATSPSGSPSTAAPAIAR